MIDRFRAGLPGLLSIFALLWALSGAVQAATFAERHYDAINDPAALDFEPRCHIQMTGEIVGPDAKAGQIGDYERAKVAIEAFRKSPKWQSAVGIDRQVKLQPAHGFFALCLSSEGGDLREALRIASLFQHDWMMVVEEGHACLSACAVLFMQAKRRDGLFAANLHASYPGRYMHHKAEIGFHAPALIYPKESSSTVAKEEAEEAYRQALISIEALLPNEALVMTAPLLPDDGRPLSQRLGELTSKLVGTARSEEDYPARLLVKMLTTPNDRMMTIKTVGDAHEYGIGVFGLPLPKRVTDRMVLAACANVVFMRCSNMVPAGQCPYQFATESGMLALTRGVPGATAISELVKGLQAGPQKFALDTAEGQQGKIQAMLADWEARTISLWPAGVSATGMRAEAVSLQRRLKDGWASPCAVVGHWAGEQLIDLELQTLNGTERFWVTSEYEAKGGPLERMAEAKVKTPEATLAFVRPAQPLGMRPTMTAIQALTELRDRGVKPESASRLRWYKMLPPTTPLAEIDDDVWRWYEQGKAVGPSIAGVGQRPVPTSAGGAPVAMTDAARTGQTGATVAKPSSTEHEAVVSAMAIKSWRQTVDGKSITLTSPQVAGKAGITIVFHQVEKPEDAGGMEPWLRAKVDAAIAGKQVRMRQQPKSQAGLWSDAVSFPNAQGIGGDLWIFQAWTTKSGAQLAMQTVPEHVGLKDSVAIEADALISKLFTQRVELPRGVPQLTHAQRLKAIRELKN